MTFREFIVNFNADKLKNETFRLFKSIVGGKWQFVESKYIFSDFPSKTYIPIFTMSLYGKSVISNNDHYVVKIFAFTNKDQNDILFYCIVKGEKTGSIKHLPSYAHSASMDLDDIGVSNDPTESPDRAIKSPEKIAEFVKNIINKWYWGENNGGNKFPDKPSSPNSKKLLYSLSF